MFSHHRELVEWSYLHGSVVWLDAVAYLSDKAGTWISHTGNQTSASLPQEVVVGREKNLLRPRDLRGFTRLQQELLCLQTALRRTHFTALSATVTDQSWTRPSHLGYWTSVGRLEGSPSSPGFSRGDCESALLAEQLCCINGPTICALSWHVHSMCCCTPQVRKMGEGGMISLLLLWWPQAEIIQVDVTLVVYLSKLTFPPKQTSIRFSGHCRVSVTLIWSGYSHV